MESVVAGIMLMATTGAFRWVLAINRRLRRIEHKLGIGDDDG